MTVRDTRTRTRARAPGAEDHPSSKAVHYQVRGPTQRGNYRSDHEVHEGRRQTGRRPAHAGSRLKLIDVPGRSRLVRQPSSRTGENPPYGMIGGIEETSASFEARSAPRSYPTVETRHMRAVLKAQINKTDRNDARGIAQMMRAGLYRPVHVKTCLLYTSDA